ncbi:multidrug MFS transporter [Saccharopolyspora erythraea D]|nr:multidrug MFS transporter [Saccharopolyspora erythraea D]
MRQSTADEKRDDMTGTTASTAETGHRRWWGFALAGAAQLMVLLDTTIVNIALPWAQRDLGLSDADRQWVVTAYMLAFGSLLLLGGRISDALGRRPSLVVGVLGFGAASAAGGAAVDAGMLITARAAQGAFAALLAPSTMALVAALFVDPRERAKALGRFSAVVGAGGALGLVAGGLLTGYLDWRWCLYVNVPVAVLVAALAPALLPNPAGHSGVRLDLVSAALATTGMAALVWGVDEASTRGWGSPVVAGLLATAIVLLTGFAVRQARTRDPLLPPHIVTDRRRVGAFCAVALTMAAMFGTMLVLTYQLQGVMGYSPLRAGLAMLPGSALAMLISSQVSGRLLPRLGARRLVVPGMLLTACGLGWLTLLNPHSTYLSGILPAQLLFGLGTGLVMTPSIGTALAGVAPRDAGATSAVVSTAQQIGGTTGIALMNTAAAAASATCSGASPITAQVHGHTVAAMWAVGFVLAGAVVAGPLLGGRPRS